MRTRIDEVGIEHGGLTKLSRLRAIVRAIRVRQIRAFARLLILVGMSRWGSRFVIRVRDVRLIRGLLNWLLAFHGNFPSIELAGASASRYVPASHEHPKQTILHANFAELTRESDYPVLFYLTPIASQLRKVFDLGGSIGNLFFQLDRHLHFSNELVWTVHDLPFKREAMNDFARAKGESRLAFSDDISSASGVDLFIVVGAIHYFEPTLAEILAQLKVLPKHVIINRSPFSSENDVVAVQDGRLWLNPCKLHSIGKLCSKMGDLGYECVASWPVHERTMRVPLFPDCTDVYRGFYFRLSRPI